VTSTRRAQGLPGRGPGPQGGTEYLAPRALDPAGMNPRREEITSEPRCARGKITGHFWDAKPRQGIPERPQRSAGSLMHRRSSCPLSPNDHDSGSRLRGFEVRSLPGAQQIASSRIHLLIGSMIEGAASEGDDAIVTSNACSNTLMCRLLTQQS
jgi:hypothetical protein